MKAYTVLVAMVMLTASAYASTGDYFANPESYSTVNTATVVRNYASCLVSGNDGVIESALAHAAVMKLALPDADYRLLEAKVAEVARTATSPEIRYKAFLTGMVLDNPNMFRMLVTSSYEVPDELFAAIASRLGDYLSEK